MVPYSMYKYTKFTLHKNLITPGYFILCSEDLKLLLCLLWNHQIQSVWCYAIQAVWYRVFCIFWLQQLWAVAHCHWKATYWSLLDLPKEQHGNNEDRKNTLDSYGTAQLQGNECSHVTRELHGCDTCVTSKWHMCYVLVTRVFHASDTRVTR